jgi:5-methylcytosine-specific restriction endonuclease McrA
MGARTTCPQCDSPWEAHSQARRAFCTVCSRYRAMKQNSQRPRRDGTTSGLAISREEFARWFALQERRCHYCGIEEERLPHLNLMTQMGMRLLRLGVDRLDGDKPYQLGNIVLACYPCNSVKSDRFTDREMEKIIGPAIAKVWRKRRSRRRPMPRPVPAAKTTAA